MSFGFWLAASESVFVASVTGIILWLKEVFSND